MHREKLERTAINALRVLAIEAIQKANSGHPGLPLGAAPMAYTIWSRFLKHNPANPNWPDRDRFVLSAGHGSMLLYALLYLTGYDLPLDEIKNFRQWGSLTPGHPESHLTPGVETTTGPLGQGVGNGVGMAMAERYLAAYFNRPGHEIVDHYTYVLASDGDMMEGVASEAASLAGHLQLGKLIVLYDDNRITIEGRTGLTFTEDVGARFAAYGWHVSRVEDGNNVEAIATAIRSAKADPRPSLIIVRTTIGYGSPHKADTPEVHGSPLGEEEVMLTKKKLGWPLEPPFYVPDEVLTFYRQAIEKGKQAESDWQRRFEAYREKYPRLADEFERFFAGELPPDWDADLPTFSPSEAPSVATRKASGATINALAGRIPNLIGGSADLAPSTKTLMNGEDDFGPHTPGGRNLHFGVREHAMGAILNGMAYHGGLIPYGATFMVFSDYMRPSIRIAALAHLHVIYVFTHDSIFVGEDGPTHQPVEHLAALRAIPGLTVIRPADANETVEAWKAALRASGPVALALTRQGVPVLDRSKLSPASGLARGAYVISDCEGEPQALIIASGSEVALALEAQSELARKGIRTRVISMPSWELFEEQPQDYKDAVLPPTVTARVVVEAGVSQGWCRYGGNNGRYVTVERFGASAPYKVLAEKFGFTAERVAREVEELLLSKQR